MQAPPAVSQTSTVGKNKVIAAILAVLLGPFVWAYTYNKDKRKFWVGNIIQFLSVAVVIVIILILSLASGGDIELLQSDSNIEEYSQALKQVIFAVLSLLAVLIGLRIWALIDRLVKPGAWYDNYPKLPLKKALAVIFAVFFFYTAWLYIYERSKGKFWAVFGITYTLQLFGNNINNDIFAIAVLVINFGLWVWAIIDVAIKPSEWYENYPDDQAPATTADYQTVQGLN